METIKFFILGISGNLAKEKVLPALGQFHGMYGDQVNIEIHGYSRSEANMLEITKMTCLANSTSCPRIYLYNGEYENNQVYHELISNLKPHERVVVYLAIPPSIFIKFLQNSCPYGHRRLDILMEKPFGVNESEAKQIIKIMEACDLIESVHFIDHYWFKNTARASFRTISKELDLDITKLQKITVQANETIDIGMRKGYYDQTGATKDMLVHLYSLLNLSKNLFENNKFDIQLQEVTNLDLGQYQTYQVEIDDLSSITETYFKANANFEYGPSNIAIEFESGKKLKTKSTQITLHLSDKEVVYNIAPQGVIEVFVDGVSTFKTILEDPKNLDHTNVFFDVWNNEFKRFVPKDQVINGWRVFEAIYQYRLAHNPELRLY